MGNRGELTLLLGPHNSICNDRSGRGLTLYESRDGRNASRDAHLSHRIHGAGIFTMIYLHEWLNFMVNVGKYASPMDAMGMVILWDFTSIVHCLGW